MYEQETETIACRRQLNEHDKRMSVSLSVRLLQLLDVL